MIILLLAIIVIALLYGKNAGMIILNGIICIVCFSLCVLFTIAAFQ
jgi:hypothetical protein